MAIKIPKSNVNLKAVELVSLSDDAVDVEKSDYEEYIKTLSEQHLHLTKTPSRFVLNLDVKGREAQSLKNSMLKTRDDEGKPTMSYGSYSFELAKMVLKDIVHPEGETDVILFQKGKDGKPSDDLLALLDRIGVVGEIMSVYSQHILNPTRAEAKN